MGKPSKAGLSKAGRTLSSGSSSKNGEEQGRLDARQGLSPQRPAPSAGAGRRVPAQMAAVSQAEVLAFKGARRDDGPLLGIAPTPPSAAVGAPRVGAPRVGAPGVVSGQPRWPKVSRTGQPG